MYRIGEKIFEGGEGAICEVLKNPKLLYKEYKPGRMNDALADKLRYMPKNMPKVDDSNSVFAWPLSLAEDEKGVPIGFIMPRLDYHLKIDEVYEYVRPWRSPVKYCMKELYKSRVMVARNICVMVQFAHMNRIIIGDFNDKNMGVNKNTGFVSMFDCDSFHLENGKYRCCVAMQSYVAPELLMHILEGPTNDYARAALPTFTRETDLFSLAIHIFRLMMNGISPYNGIDMNIKSSSATVSAGAEPILNGYYCFREDNGAFVNKPKSPLVPPIHILTDTLGRLFHRAFLGDPKERPRHEEWVRAIDKYHSCLTECKINGAHWYHRGLTGCPWCEADKRQRANDENYEMPGFTITRNPSYIHEFE